MTSLASQARWDWMALTVPAFPMEIANRLLEELPGASSLSHGRGRQNYHHSTTVVASSGDVLATVLHGGPNGNPHVVCTGPRAHRFAEGMRTLYPDHRVSRMDSSVDVQGDFGQTRELLIDFAARRDIHQAEQSSGYGATLGRTFYLGSTKSRVRVRAYEKWPELLAKGEDPDQVPRDAIRYEVQHRPDKDAKARAASITPAEAWGLTDWTYDLSQDVLGLETYRQPFQYRQRTSIERAEAAMLKQYRNLFFHLLGQHGSPEAVGTDIFAKLRGIADD